jgi:hypothetical protein
MPLLRKAGQDHGGVGQSVLTAKRKANTYPRREQPSGRSLRLFAAVFYTKTPIFIGIFLIFQRCFGMFYKITGATLYCMPLTFLHCFYTILTYYLCSFELCSATFARGA